VKSIWQFIRVYEWWFLMLIVVALNVLEYRTDKTWMGNVGFVVFVVACLRLAKALDSEKRDE